jgi:hypothetical protein
MKKWAWKCTQELFLAHNVSDATSQRHCWCKRSTLITFWRRRDIIHEFPAEASTGLSTEYSKGFSRSAAKEICVAYSAAI